MHLAINELHGVCENIVRYLKVVEPKALGVEGGFLFIMPALSGLVLLSDTNFCPLKNVYSRKRICVLFYQKNWIWTSCYNSPKKLSVPNKLQKVIFFTLLKKAPFNVTKNK